MSDLHKMIDEFEKWRQVAPHRRSYHLYVDGGNVNVFVYDHVWKVGQRVNSVKEINLVAERRKEVRRATLNFLFKKRKRPAAADLSE